MRWYIFDTFWYDGTYWVCVHILLAVSKCFCSINEWCCHDARGFYHLYVFFFALVGTIVQAQDPSVSCRTFPTASISVCWYVVLTVCAHCGRILSDSEVPAAWVRDFDMFIAVVEPFLRPIAFCYLQVLKPMLTFTLPSFTLPITQFTICIAFRIITGSSASGGTVPGASVTIYRKLCLLCVMMSNEVF